jgi:allantoin racemase
MTELLILNPNTSASVSALLQRHAQAAAGPGVHVRTRTARFGAPYIACEATYAVAGHALLDAWAAALAEDAPAPDAVLIGCFGDPGLLALRETSRVPVTGLAEASFIEGAAHGRFAVVTGGVRWQPILQRLAAQLGYGAALTGVHTVAPTGAQLAADRDAAIALLAKACRDAVKADRADAVVLGGAGLAGMAAAIAPLLDVPVIDSVLAGTRQALARAALNGGAAAGTGRFDVQWQRLSIEITALGQQ